MRRNRLLATALTACLGAPGCKVPLSDINAGFVLADAAWFAEEETMFVFYELVAEQGLGARSVLEIRYTTDDGVVDWTELSALPQVHTHVPTACDFDTRCGSGSLHVRLEPRDVALRLRYHRDGALSLESETVLNIVGPGPAHTHRSVLVYGVFDARNRGIQWRARHRFPTIRNEEAERLGLRRELSVEARRYGEEALADDDNPYLYGAECPDTFSALERAPVETDERAAFDPDDLPTAASDAATVCADSTVHDATGPFSATAVARKNPEVRPAFPVLRSPIRDATPIKYMLEVCERSISSAHKAMQRQRLLTGDISPVCVDDWMDGGLTDELVALLRDDIERVRADGRDMVLVIGLHHDTPAIGAVVEEALSKTLETEAERNTPRVAGVFVLDSFGYAIEDADLARQTIWCPATLPDAEEVELEDAGGVASLVCVVVPDLNLSLGPFDIGALPILPSRESYLSFIDQYSDAQAGTMKSLTFRVPELPPSAEHVRVDPVGVATFFNGEVITADEDDAFSFCETDEYEGFVFRYAIAPDVPLPLAALPDLHNVFPTDTYPLGVFWEFPYLLRLEYEAVAALSVSAFGASVPFGIGVDTELDYGSGLWGSDAFPLAETLAQCRRFCDHPTFDAAGVYQVGADFRTAYKATCYRPSFPERGDSGFPDDP